VWESEIEKLGAEIDRPEDGSVERKALQIRKSIQQIETISVGWYRELVQDITDRREKLETKLEELSEIVSLDDPAIDRSKYLLTQDAPGGGQTAEADDQDVDLNTLIGKLKIANEYWQSVSAVMLEVEERVEKPLVEAHQDARKQREITATLAERASAMIPDKPGWPPTAGVKKLGELAAEYRSLGENIHQTIRWARAETSRVEELEKELNDLDQAWIQRERSLSHLPNRMDEVHRWRLEMEQNKDMIKNNWLTGGHGGDEMAYDQVVKDLNTLIRLNRERQISLDDVWGDDKEGEADI